MLPAWPRTKDFPWGLRASPFCSVGLSLSIPQMDVNLGTLTPNTNKPTRQCFCLRCFLSVCLPASEPLPGCGPAWPCWCVSPGRGRAGQGEARGG